MNIIKTTIIVALLAFVFTSCSDDDETNLDNDLDCTSNFENHINAHSFQTLIDSFANDGFVGMSLLVDHPTDGLWMGSAGYANIEDEVLMNPCHIHHAASIYKTYIATIIMQFVEEGKINLNSKLTDYLSTDITDRLPNGSAVTIKNLLQQRSGIPDIFESEFLTDFFNNPTKQYTIEELLEYIYDKDPLSEVDTEFHYSDANFSLLTLVIQETEGDFIQVLKKRIFEPLELDNTYFLENTNPIPAGLANSYWDRFSNGNFENNTEIQIAVVTGLKGSEGIATTVNDLKTFIQALANGNLVSNVSLMTDFLDVPTMVQEREVYSGYGMGLMKVEINEEVWYGHFGNQIGSGANVLYNADKDITIVALQNTGTFFSDDIKAKFFYQLLNDVENILF